MKFNYDLHKGANLLDRIEGPEGMKIDAKILYTIEHIFT